MTGSQVPSLEAISSLIDHNGKAVDEGTFLGLYTLIFFGFTHCRVVCPRTLEKITRVLDRLGPAAAKIQPIYISVDPERDTPEVLRAFLSDRYPRFTGVTGSPKQIDHAKQTFRIFAQRQDEGSSAYSVQHTAITYAFDPAGRLVDHWLESISDEALGTRLTALLVD